MDLLFTVWKAARSGEVSISRRSQVDQEKHERETGTHVGHQMQESRLGPPHPICPCHVKEQVLTGPPYIGTYTHIYIYAAVHSTHSARLMDDLRRHTHLAPENGKIVSVQSDSCIYERENVVWVQSVKCCAYPSGWAIWSQTPRALAGKPSDL